MAKNTNYFPGAIVPLTVPYSGGVTSGQGVLSGAIFGVALASAAQNERVDCAVVGVHTLPKASGAITEGARLFWDNSARNVTTTAGTNFHIGFALRAAAAGDTTVQVLLGRGPAAGA